MYEFNLAAAGYWRNWERWTAWAVREINTVAIQGSQGFKQSSKPKRPTDLFKLSIDKEKKKPGKPTIEELKKTHAKFFEYGSEDIMAKDKRGQ